MKNRGQGLDERGRVGLIHIYTGDGKGKTTSAIGLSLRAVANGYRVCIIQFLKAESEESGEIRAIKQFEKVNVLRFSGNLLTKNHPPVETIKSDISVGIAEAVAMVEGNACDIMVLDEINVAVSLGLASLEDVLNLISKCKGRIELVLTGRNAHREMIEIADYVTEFKMLKHPFEAGIKARRGIEY